MFSHALNGINVQTVSPVPAVDVPDVHVVSVLSKQPSTAHENLSPDNVINKDSSYAIYFQANVMPQKISISMKQAPTGTNNGQRAYNSSRKRPFVQQ